MLLRDFQYDKEDGRYSHVLASAKGTGDFWILLEVNYKESDNSSFQKRITAIFCKMSSSKGMTYYKEIDIDSHPYYYSCPKSWLDKLQPSTKYGEEWLENARAYHSKEKKICKGMKFKFTGTLYEVVEYYGGGSWIVSDRSSGTPTKYRMKSETIRNSLQVSS